MAELRHYTSLRVGGPAKKFVDAHNEKEIVAAIEAAGDSPESRELRERGTRPLRAGHDVQGDPRNALPDGAAHDLPDGGVRGQLLREALRAGVRARLPVS